MIPAARPETGRADFFGVSKRVVDSRFGTEPWSRATNDSKSVRLRKSLRDLGSLCVADDPRRSGWFDSVRAVVRRAPDVAALGCRRGPAGAFPGSTSSALLRTRSTSLPDARKPARPSCRTRAGDGGFARTRSQQRVTGWNLWFRLRRTEASRHPSRGCGQPAALGYAGVRRG